METRLIFDTRAPPQGFKSYYVVWKQLCCERKITQA